MKIADFGISKRAQAGDETLRTLVYSPHYVAPEVLVDDSSYTRAVDVWSIGTIAFCLLTGEKTLLERRERRWGVIAEEDCGGRGISCGERGVCMLGAWGTELVELVLSCVF